MTDYGNGGSSSGMPGDEPAWWCQCEHACHPSSEEGLVNYPHHDYGQEFPREKLTEVHTGYGTFMICDVCNQNHPIPKEYLA